MSDQVLVEEKDVSIEKIEQEATKGHVLDVAPGCLSIELPAGMIHDGEVHVDAVVKEMTGNEEDLLAGKGSIVARLNAIIGNCLVHLGSVSDKAVLRRGAKEFTAQDRMAILIAIRRVSLGDYYDCSVTCPECKLGQQMTLNLSEIDVVPMPNRMERESVDELPSGTEVKWHVIRSEDEEWLTEQRKKKQDLLTLNLLARVDAIGDEDVDRVKGYRKAMAALKNLSIRDRVALRELFEKKEGNIDTSVQFACEECGHQWEGTMNVGQSSFFFPSAK